ncbi:Cj0069 family protein [Halarcobacter sp.]|uniref:Cj0069 family protein n=1 Tax=Halarcobacter sp. TaxID=2321133 RepID=UPI002AA7E237|nr:Cj0069 family protein [Halarcobacter sp.]
MKNKIFIIEYQKGSDKGFDGFRADTKPILDAIEKETNYKTEIVFYKPNRKYELLDYLKERARAVISRINPGNLKEVDEYFQFLKALGNSGVEVHTHPDVMINLDFKDILAKLKGTRLGDDETYFYHTYTDFVRKFPEHLNKHGIRVLKTNYGSTGEGVYLVSKKDDGSVFSVEAVNNEKFYYDNINEFLEKFESKFEEESENAAYFKGKTGFVGCRYLQRISEGEIRILLVNNKAISVVHKKPQEGEFSATLFSGAKYNYESPNEEKWKDVVELTMEGLKDIKPFLNGQNYPLLWTMDYILDYDEKGKDKYILSEINCSCVGITTELQYAKDVANVFAKKEKKLKKK